MTSTDTLLPCPFCGGAAEVREWDFPYVRFQARCVECKTTGRTRFNERAKAIAAWNRRTPPTPATEEREAVTLNVAEATDLECLIMEICGDVAELPDRTSPEDQPDMMLVEFEELQIILSNRITPFVAAEILAAEANERARWADWARVRSALNHRWAAEGEHLRTERIALSSAYAELADAIERNEHGAGK